MQILLDDVLEQSSDYVGSFDNTSDIYGRSTRLDYQSRLLNEGYPALLSGNLNKRRDGVSEEATTAFLQILSNKIFTNDDRCLSLILR
jgi:hypothetical protein